MNNKIMGYFLAAFFVLGTSVYAQDLQLSLNDRVYRMTRELNLTDTQADAVKPIIKGYMTKREAALQEAQTQAIVDHAALRNAIEALKRDQYQKLSKILSEDQLHRWIQKENLRAALNKDNMEGQFEEGPTLTADGANLKF